MKQKYLVYATLYTLFLSTIISFAGATSEQQATEVRLLEVEVREIFSNPANTYVYIGRALSDILPVMEEISSFDQNQESLIHGLLNHARQGYSIGNYDAVGQALEQAQTLLRERRDSLDPEKARELSERLQAVIALVVEERLNLDADSLASLRDSIELSDDVTRACCSQSSNGLRLLIVREKVDFNGKVRFRNTVVFRDEVRFHDDVRFLDDVRFDDDVEFNGDVTINGPLNLQGGVIGLGGTTIGCDVTVGCNLVMSNSVNPAVGNIIKGGARFMHNFGANNTFLGSNAGNFTLAGTDNTGVGFLSLAALTDGNGNTAVGSRSLLSNTDGDSNTAVGTDALALNTTGSNNIALGVTAGSAHISGDNNIYIGNLGFAVESNTIRIGSLGTQTETFIQGISGATTSLVGVPVLVDVLGQLGTISSSVTTKHNIHDMADASNNIYNLRPVTFAYNVDPLEKRHYGLIAEEVNAIMPDLVAHDQNNNPYAVLYHDLPVMLLNELKKLAARVAVLEGRA